MDVRNCRRCGRMFNYIAGAPICPACKEGVEKKFQEVKEYVRSNAHVGIREVAEACDIEITQVQQWIREERLVFSEDSAIGINCEKCGAMIRTGRFCENCKNKMAQNLNSSIKKSEPEKPEHKEPDKTNPKMRFL